MRSAELRQQRLRLGLLVLVALVQHFLQNFAGAFYVAHLVVGLREIELRRGVVPLAIDNRWRRILESRRARIE